MRLGLFYESVVGALTDTPITIEELCEKLGERRLRGTLERLDSALYYLAREGYVVLDTGGATDKRAWRWRRGSEPVVLPSIPRPAPAPEPPLPEPERRGGRPSMGSPDYVYKPLPEKTKEKMRAAARKRIGAPEGFSLVYGYLVPTEIAGLCRQIAAKAVYQEKKRAKKGKP